MDADVERACMSKTRRLGYNPLCTESLFNTSVDVLSGRHYIKARDAARNIGNAVSHPNASLPLLTFQYILPSRQIHNTL